MLHKELNCYSSPISTFRGEVTNVIRCYEGHLEFLVELLGQQLECLHLGTRISRVKPDVLGSSNNCSHT